MELFLIKSVWAQIDFNQDFFIFFHSHKNNCDKNKNKQYRNFIPIQYIESFKHQLEGIYILKC